MQKRIAKVSELLLAGVSRAQIVQFSAKEWATGIGTADRYIAEAMRQIGDQFAPDLKCEAQKALNRYEAIFARCMSAQKYTEAAAAQDRICKLLGLYQPDRMDLTGDVKHEILVKIGGRSGPNNG